MLSGYLVSVHNLLPHLLAVGWFPLTLLYFIKYCDTKKNKHLVLSVTFLVIELFAGAAEIVMLTFFVLFIIAINPTPFLRNKPPRFFERVKTLFFLSLLFLILSSVQMIPFYELKIQSIRSTGLSYPEATTWSFAWKDFILFFLPDVFGYGQTETKYWLNQSWLKTVYLGFIPFIASIFFFISKDKKRLVLLFLIIVSLLLALGKNTPFYKLLYLVPPFDSIRYPVKFLFLFFFVISITSALGFDRLESALAGNEKRAKKIVMVIFYTGSLFAAFWGYSNIFADNVHAFLDIYGFKPDRYNEIWFNLHNMKRLLLFSFLFCMVLLIFMRVRQKKYVMFVMIALLIADLFFANYGYYHTASWRVFVSEHKFTPVFSATREAERYFVTNKTIADVGRSFPTDKAIMSSPYAPVFGFYTIGGMEIMRITKYELFLNILLGSPKLEDAKRYMDISGVRFMIASYKVDDRDFKLREQIEMGKETVNLYEYTRYMERFLLFGKARKVGNEEDMITALVDRDVDLKKDVIILSKDTSLNMQGDNVEGEVKLLTYRPNKVILEYESDRDAFLYLSDTYYPGWRAYVDGKRTKIYRANLAFRAVEVPAGRHTVVFKYVPMSFYVGLALTLFGIALCVWLWRRDTKALPAGDEMEDDPKSKSNEGSNP